MRGDRVENGLFPEGFEDFPEDVQQYLIDFIQFSVMDREAPRWESVDDWGTGKIRPGDQVARNKQLPPDHPKHHEEWIHPQTGIAYKCESPHGPDGTCPDWDVWIFMAGRGCVAGHTRIYLPLEDRHERIDVLAAAGRPATVLSLTDAGPRPARTEGAPFLKGTAPLFEVRTDDGSVITVTDHHRFLTPRGWRRLAGMRAGQLLAAGAPVPQDAVSALPGWRAGAPNSTRTAAGCPGGCPTCRRYGDRPLPAVSGNGQASSPSPAGAGGRNPRQSHADDQGHAEECNRSRLPCTRRARTRSVPAVLSVPGGEGPARSAGSGLSPHRIPGFPPSPGMTSGASAVPGASQRECPVAVLPHAGDGESQFSHAPAGVSRLPGVSAARSGRTPRRPSRYHGRLLRSGNGRSPETAEYSSLLGSTACVDAIRWTRVLSIVPAGTGFFYDMHVPGPENYAAEGMFHHNTGKTLAGSQWTLSMARKEPKVWVGVCAPTFADIKNVCFEGTSGLINVADKGEIIDYNKNGLKITLRNGSIIQGYSAEKPDSIRGANLYGAWFDELAMIRYLKFYDYGLEPALRVGSGRLMVTTTPRRMKLIRNLVAESRKNPLKVHLTEATSDENPYVGKMVAKLRSKYAGTVLERQELGGELLDEVDGALFTVDMFADNRVFDNETPEFRRIVVSLDPATTASDASDETGIMVCAEGSDRHFYTLEDCSLKGTPEVVMSAAVSAYHRWDADCIVGEVNGVGDYLKAALYHVDPYVPFRTVRGMKGKYARAEPVSVLAQQGKIHMIGTGFDKLEEQLCAFSSDDDRTSMHDDRADAWVWGMLELSGLSQQVNYREMYGFIACEKCGEQVHEREKKCGHCGTEIHKPDVPASARGEKRWAAAYMNTCDKCGTMYSMREKRCTKCDPAPAHYLAQVGKLSGTESSWLDYLGKDWFRGRRV